MTEIEAIDSGDFLAENYLFENVPSTDLAPQIISDLLVRRAIVDVGSGGTKYTIADYNYRTGDLKVVHEGKVAVAYQKALEKSVDRQFDRAIKDEGLAAFREIKKVCDSFGVNQIHAVATEAFRQAGASAQDFTKEILDETGISVNIIDQTVEGNVAYYNALRNTSHTEEDLVVWEIGTGSFQLVAKGDDEYQFHMGAMGSVPFFTEIMKEVKGDILEMGLEGLQKADALARAVARRAESLLKVKIRGEADRTVVGIGNFFVRSLGQYAKDPSCITRDDLRTFIRETLSNASASEDPFLKSDLSNAILALGFMKGLQIHRIEMLDASNAEAMLTYTLFWKA